VVFLFAAAMTFLSALLSPFRGARFIYQEEPVVSDSAEEKLVVSEPSR
jgi:hypothetical protein